MPVAEAAKLLYEEACDLAWIQHKPKKALAKFAEALQLDREYAEAMLGMAMVFLFCLPDRVQDAKVTLEEYLSARPDDAYGHYLLGVLHRRNEEFRQAELAFRRSLQLDPSEMKSAVSLGLLCMDENRIDEAVSLLRQAADYLAATHGHFQASVRLWLADALVKAGDIEGALKEWQTVSSMPEIWPEEEGSQVKAKRMLKKYSSTSKQ